MTNPKPEITLPHDGSEIDSHVEEQREDFDPQLIWDWSHVRAYDSARLIKFFAGRSLPAQLHVLKTAQKVFRTKKNARGGSAYKNRNTELFYACFLDAIKLLIDEWGYRNRQTELDRNEVDFTRLKKIDFLAMEDMARKRIRVPRKMKYIRRNFGEIRAFREKNYSWRAISKFYAKKGMKISAQHIQQIYCRIEQERIAEGHTALEIGLKTEAADEISSSLSSEQTNSASDE